MTADEETDVIISDYELMMRDIRDGICEGLFIIGSFVLLFFIAWTFA